jgi:hypothetical protein
MQRFYLVASDPDGEMDAEPREDDLGEWVLHRDAQAEVDRLQSDLRTAIDERDRAQAEVARMRAALERIDRCGRGLGYDVHDAIDEGLGRPNWRGEGGGL